MASPLVGKTRELAFEAQRAGRSFANEFAFGPQNTAFGSQTFKKNAQGQLERTTRLDPRQQELFQQRTSADSQRNSLISALLGQAQDNQFKAFDFSALPARATLSGADFSGDRNRIEQSLFNRSKELLLPEFDRQRDRQEQILSNRGIPLGSVLQQDQTRNLERTFNDALSGEAARAIAAGGTEQSRLQGLELQRLSAQQGIRSNALQEALLERGLPVREAGALLAQQGSLIQPQFLSPTELSSIPLEFGFSSANLGQQSAITDLQLQQQRTLANAERRQANNAQRRQLAQQQRQFETNLLASELARQSNLEAQFANNNGEGLPLAESLPEELFTLPEFRQASRGRLGSLGRTSPFNA